MRGYSQSIIEANQKAPDSTGVSLGRICIASKYPASQVAKTLHVSRQTVYDWFSGKTKPSKHLDVKIIEFTNKLLHT
jgi:DNA-binding XRE family transcriptional regulator